MPTYKCSHCKYASSQKHSVLRHIKAKHKKDYGEIETVTFYCFGCDYDTTDKDELINHIDENHKGILFSSVSWNGFPQNFYYFILIKNT